MKKFLGAAAIAALMILAGCPTPTENPPVVEKAIDAADLAVGDTITGGFVVTQKDANTGVLATKGNQGLVYGRFTANVTLTSDKTWQLYGPVFIGNDNTGNATITIQAGTTVTGVDLGTTPGFLVITRGSQIQAVGTAANPIVFTSAKAAGDRARGDWGGLIINGNARINPAAQAEGEGNSGFYGGTNDDDDSGELRYVRVEFAGRLFTAENELNGIALQGVGRGTKLSYIQVHMGADDGIEFFGGSANIKYFIVTGADDDSLDWTYGWTGSAQFGIIQQYPNSGDSGIEADSNATAGNTPVSDPVLSNLTVVGRGQAVRGARFRLNTRVRFFNSIVHNFAALTGDTNPALIDDTASQDPVEYRSLYLTATNQQSRFRNGASSVFYTAGNNNVEGTFADTNLPAGAVASLSSGSYSFAFKPSAAITGYTAYALPSGLTGSANYDLVAAAYAGAVDPAATTPWYEGWITTDAN